MCTKYFFQELFQIKCKKKPQKTPKWIEKEKQQLKCLRLFLTLQVSSVLEMWDEPWWYYGVKATLLQPLWNSRRRQVGIKILQNHKVHIRIEWTARVESLQSIWSIIWSTSVNPCCPIFRFFLTSLIKM